jgi:hypothetical protein
MSEHPLTTPVALFIYNRPHTTQRVFAEIRRARPRQLLVVADGPAMDQPRDVEMCSAVRALIEEVDWECDLTTEFSEANLGCRRRISTGLDWVFQTVDKAIILEDDCLPHPTFFRFCHELLQKYAHEERVAMISGNNFNRSRARRPYSYSFSMYPLTWGWASWARVWKYYDAQLKQWPLIQDGGWLRDLIDDPASVRYWKRIFQKVYQGDIDTWDYQWTFSCWVNGLLTIHPAVNLVSNIGFDKRAVHTKDPTYRRAHYRTQSMVYPLSHPPFLIRDIKRDDEIKKVVHGIYPFGGTFLARAGRVIRRMATWPLRKYPLSRFFYKMERSPSNSLERED